VSSSSTGAYPSNDWCVAPNQGRCLVIGKKPGGFRFKVVRVLPHDSSAFTQGLAYYGGFLYEGTGRYGNSSIRKINIQTGEILVKQELSADYFGEDIATCRGKLLQLTWQSQVGFIYSSDDLRPLGRFKYNGEGWGFTSNDSEFFLSNGTAEIAILDNETFTEKRRIWVHDGAQAITRLNALCFVESHVFANIWFDDRIACICPFTGTVVDWFDLAGILSSDDRPLDSGGVLNGIAYDPEHKRLFVCGKLWPAIFEMQAV